MEVLSRKLIFFFCFLPDNPPSPFFEDDQFESMSYGRQASSFGHTIELRLELRCQWAGMELGTPGLLHVSVY